MSVRWARRKPKLETLEDRWVPASVSWISPVDGDWASAEDWSTGSVPTTADDVFIPSGVVVTHSFGIDAVKSLDCDGGLIVSGGSLTLIEASTIADLTFSGGALNALGGLSVTDSFDWISGTLGGTKVSLFGDALFRGLGDMTLGGVTLENHADLLWTGGAIAGTTGKFENKADGVVEITGGTSIAAPFANGGSLIVATPQSVTFAAVMTTGVVILESGGINAESYVQLGGMTYNEGSSLAVPTYRLLGGTFAGFGVIIGDVENRGTFASAGGTLYVVGDYDQAIGATLSLVVGDSQLESAPPFLVNGKANLAGTLVVKLDSGVEPVEGEIYAGLFAGDRMGFFTTVNGAVGDDLQLVVIYRDDGFDLLVVPSPPGATPGPNAPIDPDPNKPPPGGPGPIEPNMPPNPGPGPGPDRPPIRLPPGTVTGNASDDPTIVNNAGQALNRVGLGGPAGPSPGPGPVPGPAAPQGGGAQTAGDGRGPMQGLPQGPPNGGGDRGRPGGGLPPPSQVPDPAAQQSGRPTTGPDRGFAGRKMASDLETGSSGLADELFSTLPLALPELELPSERDLLSMADVAAALLVNRRARANLVRGGSQLSGVATVLVSEDGGEQGPDVSPFAGLFMSPLTGLRGQLPGEPVSRAEVPAEEEIAAEDGGLCWSEGGLALAGTMGAGLALAVALGRESGEDEDEDGAGPGGDR